MLDVALVRDLLNIHQATVKIHTGSFETTNLKLIGVRVSCFGHPTNGVGYLGIDICRAVYFTVVGGPRHGTPGAHLLE